ARGHEAFLVIDLDHVIQDGHVHRGGKEIFTDALDDVRARLGDLASLVKVVVQRTLGIDADNSHLGIFLFQIFANAADGATRAQSANEVRDFAFGVFPNFWPSSLVVRLRIAGIVVLIWVVGIGDFAREFLRNAVVAARVFRLYSRGTNDHFGAKGFEQVHFFLGLLVGGSEHALITAHRRHQRQSHAGVPAGALNNGAAGLQQALFFRVVDHGDADAVFHG